MQEDTVTRAHLANSIYKKFGYSRAEAADLVDAVFDEVNGALKNDEEVKISSFGTFKVRKKDERVGRNPKTKEEVAISARKVVSFYVSNLLKKKINNN
jgi:integration host factor subunit alpha